MFVYIVPIFVSALLALLCELGIIKSNKYIYGFLLLIIAVFAGLRYETGQDWLSYKNYFNRIELIYGPIDSYFSDLGNFQFEIGYFLINYYIKTLGFSYSVVFLIASLFCSYCVFRFTSVFNINKYFILTNYISFSFMVLHFAQVRQSIAIGFFFLGCYYFLKNENKLKGILICLFGLLFQFSSIIYIILLLFVLYYPKKVKYQIVSVLIVLVLFIVSLNYGMYSVLKLVSPTSLYTKIDIYEEEQSVQGSGQLFNGLYLLVCAGYITYFMRNLRTEYVFICKFAVFSLLLTIFAIFVFPGNYVMYSRLYVLSAIFQGFAMSIIFSITKNILHKLIFVASVCSAIIFYGRILIFYSNEYGPYRSVLDQFFYIKQ